MRTITVVELETNQACSSQVALFKRLFGESVEITEQLCLDHHVEFNWHWTAQHFLTAPALTEFSRITAPAWAEYTRIEDQAWSEFSRITDQAITDQARAEYVRITAPAWAEYARIGAQAFARAYLT